MAMNPFEEWRPIARCPLYEISNLGRVRRVTILSSYVNTEGYPTVQMWQGNSTRTSGAVHRLLAEAFLPNPDNLPQVDHKNANKLDYSLSNLEWVTGLENQRRSWKTGLRKNKEGAEHGMSKLTAPQVRCIRAFRYLWRQRSMARHFGISQHNIMQIQ